MSDTTDLMGVTADTPATDASAAPATGASAGRRRRGTGLEGMVLAELQQVASGLGIKGTARMRKSQLIEVIKEAQAAGGAPAKSAPAAASAGDAETKPKRRATSRARTGDAAEKAAATKAAKAAPAAKKKGPVVLDKFQEGQKKLLLEEKERLTRHSLALKAEADSLALDREAGDTQFDDESGEGDTLAVERERDLVLSAQGERQIDELPVHPPDDRRLRELRRARPSPRPVDRGRCRARSAAPACRARGPRASAHQLAASPAVVLPKGPIWPNSQDSVGR